MERLVDAAAPARPAGGLSLRGARARKPALPYFELHSKGCAAGVWSPERPDGFIGMAIAENKLSFAPTLMTRLASCRAIDASTGAYDDMRGRAGFRAAFARQTTRTLFRGSGLAIDPADLCVSSGCGASILQLAMLLLDAGDAVLLPTPTYAALYNDMQTLAFATIVDIPTEGDAFRLTRGALDAAVAECRVRGAPPRLLFIINPSNPLGIVYSEDELRMARAFCAEHGMHLVVDEIYANSVYSESSGSPFRSIASICAEEAGAGQQRFLGDSVHVLWGTSKDWAISGYRVGVLYSHNAELLAALDNVNYFTTVSNDTQDALALVMSDDAFVDGYLEGNRAALRDAYECIRPILEAASIPFLWPSAGMFVWLDLRSLLPAGVCGWDAERQLVGELFQRERILFTPGESCHAASPGWARCCFGAVPRGAVIEAFTRLARFADAKRAAAGRVA